MSASIPTTEPEELRVGLTWQWRREDLADYPASTWTLTYWFKQQASSGAKFSIVASADGDAYSISVAAATTAGYTADDYTWVAVVTSGTEAFEVDHGTAKILPKYNADAALDDRSHAKKVLEAIEAVIEGRASKDQEEYTIGNRSLKRTPLEDLMKLRNQYKAEVFREQLEENARNGKQGSKLVVRL
jgi:hypothetical protein